MPNHKPLSPPPAPGKQTSGVIKPSLSLVKPKSVLCRMLEVRSALSLCTTIKEVFSVIAQSGCWALAYAGSY